ncbi:peptidyl-prolyl cis-trans isomerase [Euphorbia peplus]|nr:peptidyl-prolyl cis-trans isomerase [Euphorbia peplus]
MVRRQSDSELGRCALFLLLITGAISCIMVYLCFSMFFKPSSSFSDPGLNSGSVKRVMGGSGDGDCCRGTEHLELWGDAVKWGSDFKVNSSRECCLACKGMCGGSDGPCLCNSWVFCGDQQACGAKFGECWLKKQKDIFEPDHRDTGNQVMWTSGLVFGAGEGIIGLETAYGMLHVKLLPDCAPRSVAYILELLRLRHCAGCQFYRAESRASFWDLQGNHIDEAAYGPPFALIQGTLEARGAIYNNIETEACPPIQRGSIAWVGSGPDFIISLANHNEWRKKYTVFGFVLADDMEIIEKIANLPTKPEVWSNINVQVLEEPVPLNLRRITGLAGLDTGGSTAS